MKLFVVDFETFYSAEYSLSRMSTEEYVCDPRFEIVMCGVKHDNDNASTRILTGTHAQIGAQLEEMGVFDGMVIAHNAMFDALIMAVHFGRVPAFVGCTRMMANPVLRPHIRSVSLKNCLQHLNLGVQKGDEVHNMLGRTRASLSRQEFSAYAKYCADDCDGTMLLFKYLLRFLPRNELRVIDMTLRMYLEPRLRLDATLLAEHLQHVKATKEQLLNSLPAGVTKDDLMSNVRFAKVLEDLGIEVPQKASPTTGKLIPALAKNDGGWKDLEEQYSDDPQVSALIAARLGSRSTLEESRTERLLKIANERGWFRVPLMYYAAHTGRYGGMEKINAQNLPRIDKSRMRFAVRAPKGTVVLAADLAQIEARLMAWFSNATRLLQGFREKADVYSEFASLVFREQVIKNRSPEDNRRRFVGKTCILGLQYGMGAERLHATLRRDGLNFPVAQCTNMVNIYREFHAAVPAMWRNLDYLLGIMCSDSFQQTVPPLVFAKDAVMLPNGMSLQYPNLRAVDGRYQYDFAGETRPIWGGTLAENIMQFLARNIITMNMLAVKDELGLRPVLQQHDELDYIVPADHVGEIVRKIEGIMRTPPLWAPDLPVEVEVAYGPSLGDCK